MNDLNHEPASIDSQRGPNWSINYWPRWLPASTPGTRCFEFSARPGGCRARQRHLALFNPAAHRDPRLDAALRQLWIEGCLPPNAHLLCLSAEGHGLPAGLTVVLDAADEWVTKLQASINEIQGLPWPIRVTKMHEAELLMCAQNGCGVIYLDEFVPPDSISGLRF
jgi:hypothetical protein